VQKTTDASPTAVVAKSKTWAWRIKIAGFVSNVLIAGIGLALAIAVRTGGVVPPTFLAVMLVLFLLTNRNSYFAPQYVGDTIWQANQHLLEPGSKLLQADLRPTILLLRTFLDDCKVVRGSSDDPRLVTLEECLCWKFNKLGPVVAVGRPGEGLPPLGAARFWVEDHQWRDVVNDIALESQYIVLIMGSLPTPSHEPSGLHWEIRRALQDDVREKLILIIPPISDEELKERWEQYRSLCGNAWPEFEGGEVVAVARRPFRFEVGGVTNSVKVRDLDMYQVCLDVRVPWGSAFRRLIARIRRDSSSVRCPSSG
jgi:hypothetical protein